MLSSVHVSAGKIDPNLAELGQNLPRLDHISGQLFAVNLARVWYMLVEFGGV